MDFYPHSEEAVKFAASMAELMGTPLLILHVVHDPVDVPGFYTHEEKKERRLQRMEDVAMEMLEEFLQTVRANHSDVAATGKLETKLVRGIPAPRILEAAEQVKASMIVMGSRGRTGLPHLLLGSKAERIAQMAPMPVTIVKAVKGEE